MPRKHFTKEFKDAACKRVMEQEQEIAPTARDLGIGEQTFRYWLVQRGWKGPVKEGLPDQVGDDPAFLKAQSRKDSTEHLRVKWSWWALNEGHVDTARKHAALNAKEKPLKRDSWKLLYCAIRGW